MKTQYAARCRVCGSTNLTKEDRSTVETFAAAAPQWETLRRLGLAMECCEANHVVELHTCPACGRFGGPLAAGWEQDPSKPAEDCPTCGRPVHVIEAAP